MQAFNRARNFVVSGCYFVDNGGGRRETLSEDHISNPSATLAGGLVSAITSNNNNANNELVYFIHGISPSDVRAYGEISAKHCKEEHVLLASVFFRRLLAVFPAEAKRRLVPSLAYQLAVSPYAPEELKIEILGALYAEPDIPERNLAIQFEKLITRPLQNVRELLQPNSPVVFVLDSVQNIDCDAVGDVIRAIAQAVENLHMQGVNAKAVITGVGYDRIVNSFADIHTTTRNYPAPISNPSSFFSRTRSAAFPFLNWKYNRSELVQRGVEIGSVFAVLTGLPLTSMVGIFILPTPLNIIVWGFGITSMLGLGFAVPIGIGLVAYKELARLVWPRSI
ncbi:hypothetical protein M413DRAFT_423274 [Hebeloma cylindrosporum]|uniref:Uncharacterized protein n=1 Tax=Hebeloma cylindrosporum TaxID=76867 RepID=A0A0C3C178_HEBCY|nr:hypothetical protein M413DRAFT_423274 [Hebeloma cylindrosporum h7]